MSAVIRTPLPDVCNVSLITSCSHFLSIKLPLFNNSTYKSKSSSLFNGDHFCRYDMVMTINADTFIRNLASAIVNKYPEMGNAILLDEMASDFLDPGGFTV
jgi:hypothetical protein